MNHRSILILALVSLFGTFAPVSTLAQSHESDSDSRPRIVAESESQAATHPTTSPTPLAPMSPVVITKTDRPLYPTPTPYVPAPRPTPVPSTPGVILLPRVSPTPPLNSMTAADLLSERILPPPTYNGKFLQLGALKSRMAEAKSFMQSRPLLISSIDGTSKQAMDIVRIAALDTKTNRMHYTLLSKVSFLSRGQQFLSSTSEGKTVRIQILRANGVNTAVSIIDDQNNSLLPMLVQYPVERGGIFHEVAYYSSAHPGTITAEISYAGKMYVRNVIDIAREKLRQKGYYVSPQVADIAERLATVEHVDHHRFNTESSLALFNEIFTLFTLNEGQTYRYAVSTAGAGGLVQMIPSTYRMVRNRHFNIGLHPDFVIGMRDHPNAALAMLLYMQDTWNDLAASPAVQEAMAQGYATQPELMSAGYNSNPARLPGYIKRGGANWKNLIPKETRMYHRIYSALDINVPMTPRTK